MRTVTYRNGISPDLINSVLKRKKAFSRTFINAGELTLVPMQPGFGTRD